MSAIDVAASTNSSAAASGKSKSEAADSDKGAFELVFEAVVHRSPDKKSSPEKAENTTQGKTSKARTDTADEEFAAPTAQVVNADGSDLSSDIVRLIGGGANVTGQLSTENNNTEKTPSTPLRRDILSHFSATRDTEEAFKADHKSPSLKIIGRETHFAPVSLPQNDGAKVLPSAMDVLIADSASDESIEIKPAKALDIGKDNFISEDFKSQSLRPAAKKGASTENKINREVLTDRGKQASTPVSTKTPIIPMTDTMMSTEVTGSVLTHVADQLISHARDLASVSGQSNAAPASAHALPHEQHDGPVRILRLQLQPEELGMITARLRIVGGVLELRLTADRQQSVEILQRDQEGLLETLRRAGYKAEIASIDFARPLNAQQATGQQHASIGSGQSFAGSPGSGGFSDGSGRPAGEEHAQHQHSANNRHSEERLTEGQNDGSGQQTRDPQSVYL